jgi:hypothetical protein
MELYCSKCNKIKSFLEFNHTNGIIDKRKGYCKECHRAYSRAHYLKNRERVLKRVRVYDRNKQKRKEYFDKIIERVAKGLPPKEIVPPKPIKANKKGKVTLREFRNTVKKAPISVSDLID